MSSLRLALLLAAFAAACDVEPPKGTNIGALREPDPAPAPPSDTTSIDLAAAIVEAIQLGGLTTLTAAWTGHTGVLEGAPANCPQIWLGPLPEDIADLDMDTDDPGMSWAANCTTLTNTSYAGFTHWTNTVTPGAGGERALAADADVLGADGQVLFSFDGEASDSLDLTSGSYTSTLDGELRGALVGLGSGFRTGGDFEATWSTSGTMRLFGTMTAFDGFGPPDQRDPASDELQDVVGWAPGMPRFTSVKFDLEIGGDCPQEPTGYLGLRGNEGFWFDVYFLPIYDVAEDSAQANAFPYEEIDNVTCDGIGTLFARNVNLEELEVAAPGWSREVQVDFGAALASLPMPTLDSYVFTVRDLPTE